MARLSASRRHASACFLLCAALGCGAAEDTVVEVVRVVPEAAPSCGAPSDARTMIVRALGEFPASEATAQSIELGGDERFSVERFPAETKMLEAEVRGFGGALRTVGRSEVFDLEELSGDSDVALFMAPLNGACETGPSVVARRDAKLAMTAGGVLIVGGQEAGGQPSLAVELYRPTEGRFESVASSTYGDTSPLGLAGASITSLPSGDVVLIGGAATAFQRFDALTEAFLAPSFYREARGHHAALALDAETVFVAGGCAQLAAGGCVEGSELVTTALLDVETGEIVSGPALAVPRIGGTAWLEGTGQVVLVGGVDGDGAPVEEAERVFLDGRASERIPGLVGASVQVVTGTIWAGLDDRSGVASERMATLSAFADEAGEVPQAAVSDTDVELCIRDSGSLLAVGAAAVQRIRTFDGVADAIDVPGLNPAAGRSSIRLRDGTVLMVGGLLASGTFAPASIYRPSLVGPYSASASASFSSAELSEGVSASRPASIEVAAAGHLELNAAGGAAQLLLAGPRPRSATLQVAMASDGASAQFFFGWGSPGDTYVVHLEGDAVAELRRRIDGTEEVLACETARALTTELSEVGGRHEVEMQVSEGRVRVGIDGLEVLSCRLSENVAGAMGVGVASADSGSLQIDLISMSR